MRSLVAGAVACVFAAMVVPYGAVASEPNSWRIEALKAGLEDLAGFEFGVAEVNGTRISYRVGGTGPALLLIHGFPESERT